MSQEQITKLNAIALISLETGKSRRVVEQMLKQMTDEGAIRMDKAPYSPAILITREDVQKVIDVLKKA